MEIDIEAIILRLGEIEADRMLGKSIIKYKDEINENIEHLNNIISVMDSYKTELMAFAVEIAYRYYLVKDALLLEI